MLKRLRRSLCHTRSGFSDFPLSLASPSGGAFFCPSRASRRAQRAGGAASWFRPACGLPSGLRPKKNPQTNQQKPHQKSPKKTETMTLRHPLAALACWRAMDKKKPRQQARQGTAKNQRIQTECGIKTAEVFLASSPLFSARN